MRRFIEAPEVPAPVAADEVAATPAQPDPQEGNGHPERPLILGFPGGDEADELALLMLADLLRAEDWRMSVLSSRSLVSERLAALDAELPAVVCCGVLPEGKLSLVRQLCKGVRSRFPRLPIVAGLWAAAAPAPGQTPDGLTDLTDAIGFTLAETRNHLVQFAQLQPGPAAVADQPLRKTGAQSRGLQSSPA